MHRPHPHLTAGSLVPAARRRLDVGVIDALGSRPPQALPLRRPLVDRLERAMPAAFFTAAPFARLAVYLRCAPPDECRQEPGPLLLEGGWLEITWPFDGARLARAGGPERDARLQESIADALLYVARRFTLPGDALRRVRYAARARILRHRRRRR